MSVTGIQIGGAASGVQLVSGTSGQIDVTTTNNIATVTLDAAILARLNSQPVSGGGATQSLLINGGMTVWQRGLTFNLTQAGSLYTADRWQVKLSAANNITVSQSASTNGAWLKLQRTSGTNGTGQVDLGQTLTINRCLGLQGKSITLCFDVYCGANWSATSLNYAILGGQGTANVSALSTGFTSQSTLGANQVSPSQTVQTVSLTVAVPAQVTQLALDLNYVPTGSALTDDSLYISNCSLQIGSTATYIPQDFASTLRACQDYYRKSYPYSTLPGTANCLKGMFFTNYSGSLGVNYALAGPIFDPMIATPTVRTWGFLGNGTNVLSAGDNSLDYAVGSATPYNSLCEKGFDIQNTSGATLTAIFGGFKFHWDCTSELS